MTAFVQSLRSVGFRGLNFLARFRFVLIGLLVLGIGIGIGQSIHSIEQGELALSIVTVIALLVITLRNPLNGLMIWILFMPFLETLINIPMGAGIPDLSFSRFLIAFMGIAMLAKAAIGKESIKGIGWVEVAIVATAIGIMAAAPRSIFPNAKGVIQMSLSWHLQPLLAYFFAKNLVRNHNDLIRLFLTIGLVGFVSGAYAAYEHATGNVLFVPRGQSLAQLELFRSHGIRMIRGIWGSTGTMGRILHAGEGFVCVLFLNAAWRRSARNVRTPCGQACAQGKALMNRVR